MKPRVFLPAILSGLLLWAAFFPLDLGPVGFIALVPWLSLVRAPVSNRRRYFAAYVGGLAFFVPALNWLRVAHPMMYFSWAGLALTCSMYWVFGLWLLRRLDRIPGFPLALSLPVVWVALEYTRAHFPTGFSFLTHVGLHQKIGFGWYFLGYTQHAFLPLIQVADLGGVYAVSFVVAAVNGLVADWASRSDTLRGWLRWPGGEPGVGPRLIPSTAGVVAVFASAVGYGMVQLDHPDFTPGPRVAAIQGNMPQLEKSQKGERLGEMYSRLHYQATIQTPLPDLIVWPETCMPIDWAELAPGENPNAVSATFREDLEVAGHYLGQTDLRTKYPNWKAPKPDWRTTTLFGLSGLEWEGGKVWRYNSALLINPQGAKIGRYDKMHLVPFGEYVPLRETFPWLNTFTPYTYDYSCRPGEHWTRFPLHLADGRTYTFACLICYEDSDPYIARQYSGPTDPVNFLINISNDGWFDGTEEHEEHLAICRFRAVEARRSIIRSVNMGISAVIDGDGRVIALPAESWSASKKVEAIVSVAIPIDDRVSTYSRLGDWIPASCWGLVLLGVLAGRFVLRGRPA